MGRPKKNKQVPQVEPELNKLAESHPVADEPEVKEQVPSKKPLANSFAEMLRQRNEERLERLAKLKAKLNEQREAEN